MKCKHNNCDEESFKDQKYCILHMKFPKRASNEFKKIAKLKDLRLNERINDGYLNFKGSILNNVNFESLKVNGDLIFAEASIFGFVNFKGATINGDLWFDGVSVKKYISLEFSTIKGNASFYNAKIGEYVIFDDSNISRYVWFEKALIGGELSFNRAEVGGSSSFKGSVIDGNVSFYGSYLGGDAWFDNAKISGDTWFDLTTINGGLSFRRTQFKNLKGQERGCRKAKIIWEKLGDREKADYHFYREMESKRKQKSLHNRLIELVVQYPFGYGVYPSRLLYCFALATIFFAILFFFLDGTSNINSFGEKLRFSFLTMIIPAYGVINAKTGIIGILTVIEALIGAFTWPTFIVTFARKYMR